MDLSNRNYRLREGIATESQSIIFHDEQQSSLFNINPSMDRHPGLSVTRGDRHRNLRA